MLNEVAEKFGADAVAIHVVWMPMLPGDDEDVARSSATLYAGDEVHQYYDPERLVGFAYRRDVFAECLAEEFAVTPRAHPLYETLRERSSPNAQQRPLWDAVLFYPPGVEWAEHAPVPTRWSKQVGFLGAEAGQVTGIFFHNDCNEPPANSDWHDELRKAMRAMRPH